MESFGCSGFQATIAQCSYPNFPSGDKIQSYGNKILVVLGGIQCNEMRFTGENQLMKCNYCGVIQRLVRLRH